MNSSEGQQWCGLRGAFFDIYFSIPFATLIKITHTRKKLLMKMKSCDKNL
jgi:hypothetical protein